MPVLDGGDKVDERVRVIAIAVGRRQSDDPVAQTLAGQPDIASVVRRALALAAALSRCDVVGGTAPGRVATELGAAAARLGLA